MAPRLEDFEVLSTIGQGSHGTIKKIKRKKDGELFVWKELHYASMTDAEKKGLVLEVNLLRELNHPNVVKFFHHVVDKSSGTLFILMEYCSGGDLQHLVNKCKKTGQLLDEAFIWKVLKQVAEALQKCHETRNGSKIILHRDIKPANVFLDDDVNAKLGDFGLARTLNSNISFANTFVGTPYYMSPEVVGGKEYNEKSDIWSLGCLIYELCSLEPPFRAHHQKELTKKILAGQFDRIPSPYSDDLWEMIMYMLYHEDFIRPTALMILHHSALLRNTKRVLDNTLDSMYDSIRFLKPTEGCVPGHVFSETMVVKKSPSADLTDEQEKQLEESLMNEINLMIKQDVQSVRSSQDPFTQSALHDTEDSIDERLVRSNYIPRNPFEDSSIDMEGLLEASFNMAQSIDRGDQSALQPKQISFGATDSFHLSYVAPSKPSHQCACSGMTNIEWSQKLENISEQELELKITKDMLCDKEQELITREEKLRLLEEKARLNHLLSQKLLADTEAKAAQVTTNDRATQMSPPRQPKIVKKTREKSLEPKPLGTIVPLKDRPRNTWRLSKEVKTTKDSSSKAINRPSSQPIKGGESKIHPNKVLSDKSKKNETASIKTNRLSKKLNATPLDKENLPSNKSSEKCLPVKHVKLNTKVAPKPKLIWRFR